VIELSSSEFVQHQYKILSSCLPIPQPSDIAESLFSD
jgi:hypothetical protein